VTRKSRSDAGESGGWEAFAEEASEGTLQPSEELEQALREAADAVEERRPVPRETASEAPSGGEAAAPPPTELDAARAELAATRDRMLRIAADLENFRRRALKDRQEALQYGHQNLVKDLLPTVDNLERAIDHARGGGEGQQEALLQGVELVLRELLSVLQRHGVKPIEAEGQPFDPSVHEAMAQAVDESVPPNTVLQVFQRGYQLKERLLRPARVVVSTSSATSKPNDGEESED
jgi:molecular chaperone GrpE